MVQNKSKLVALFIGNISNSIIHKVLEKSTEDKELSNKYNEELTTSLSIARKYRDKINPINSPLPDEDINFIKNKITNKVKAELLLRISKGYEKIDLDLVEGLVDEALKDTNII